MRAVFAVTLSTQAAAVVAGLLYGLGPVLALNLFTMALLTIQLVKKSVKPEEEVIEARVRERTGKLEKLMTHYEQQAMTDALTGLLNRRGGEEAIQRNIARSLRIKTAISFILIDIDYFKKVNDRYGHATGDLVISGVSNAIRSNLRTADFGIRWGGEEYLLCLPDTDLSGAIVVAEKLRAVVEKLDFDITPVTISLGCAELGEDPFHLALARADMHLYFAKSKGRNQVFPNSLQK
jgi:diguanylate cyclase (GGDEF)-like protein